eukprot:Platyproteum_vivax@DN7615_c0_g2_i4.p1
MSNILVFVFFACLSFLCESSGPDEFSPVEFNYTESYISNIPRCDFDKPLEVGLLQDWTKVHRFLHIRRSMFDTRMNIPVVRTIALVGREHPDGWFNLADPDSADAHPVTACELYWNTTNQYEIVSMSFDMLTEYSNLKFGGAFLLCPLSNELKYDPPSQVSLVVQTPTCYERVVTFDLPENPLQFPYVPKYELSLCLTPFYGYLNHDEVFDNILLMVEWIELNKILGVSHFTFYEGPVVSENVTLLLRHYEEQGVIEFVKWAMPLTPFVHVHAYAQNAMLQDCWMHNIGQSEWVTSIDTDEFFIPKSHYDLLDLIKTAQQDILVYDTSEEPSDWPYEPPPDHPDSFLELIDRESTDNGKTCPLESDMKLPTFTSAQKLPYESKVNSLIPACARKPIFNIKRSFTVLQGINRRKKNMVARGFYDSFMFRNTFYFLEMVDEELKRTLPFPLATQSIVERHAQVYSWAHRSKAIYRPVAAVTVGVHTMEKIVPGARCYSTSLEQGKLHVSVIR